jgi:uncharacterized protein (TIGR02147 family)
MWQEEFRALLKSELDRRKVADIDFSMNRFAKQAGVSASTMSELISGKRDWKITEERAAEIISRISMSEKTRHHMLARLDRAPIVMEKVPADESQYAFLTSWKHRAVMLALELPPRERSHERLCQRFALTSDELNEILSTGLECGVLQKSSAGDIVSTKNYWSTIDNIPHEVVRQHHIQNVDRIRQAVEEIPYQRRDCTSLSFVGSSKKLEMVRKELRALHDRVNSMMFDEDENDEVFQLSIALFPLSRESRS